MRSFISNRQKNLEPYVPGQQLAGSFIKLNTNELAYPPSAKALEFGYNNLRPLNIYNDTECSLVKEKLAEIYDVETDEIIMGLGADEVLNFCFIAFMDEKSPVVFPDITYGFYKTFADINRVPYEEIPLKEDFTIDPKDYMSINKNIVITNPNAPTGFALDVSQIEEILKSNPDNVVIIDEAYVDFGGESCIPLIRKYDNLVVVHTFSKSRGMAGGRLGYAIACKGLIKDLNTIKNSMDPYNISSLTQAVALGILNDPEYLKESVEKTIEAREFFKDALRKLGFEVLDSKTNFVLAKSDKIDGKTLNIKLKEKGVLVRYFNVERIKQYNRISIGTKKDMQTVLEKIEEILKGE